MSIPYEVFEDAYLNKITDYDYIKMDQDIGTEIIDGYMKRACSEFDTICKGLELVKAETSPDGLRAYNMLEHMKGLIKERG